MSAKPVVYFIDDSATMREVIKIAFHREDLDVITCHDASSALDLMDHSAPERGDHRRDHARPRWL